MTTFLTSDSHWGHSNILHLCNRPWLRPGDMVDHPGGYKVWASPEIKELRTLEMDEALIDRWNAVVGKRDLVYHLGDFAYNKTWTTQDLDKVFNRLNGKIILVKGNHGKLAWGCRSRFHAAYDGLAEVDVDGQTVVLCHYAMRTWKGSHRGAFHIYGHSHGTLSDDPNSRSFDVGVDCHNFAPISFEQVKEIMSKKNFKPVDHHKQ